MCLLPYTMIIKRLAKTIAILTRKQQALIVFVEISKLISLTSCVRWWTSWGEAYSVPGSSFYWTFAGFRATEKSVVSYKMMLNTHKRPLPLFIHSNAGRKFSLPQGLYNNHLHAHLYSSPVGTACMYYRLHKVLNTNRASTVMYIGNHRQVLCYKYGTLLLCS